MRDCRQDQPTAVPNEKGGSFMLPPFENHSDVIPGWRKDQTWNLEIPGSMLRIAPE